MASMKLREGMRKWCRFKINIGNTGVFVAHYTGRSSSRNWGSIFLAPRLKNVAQSYYATPKNVTTLEKPTFIHENCKCESRGRDRRVN